MSKLLLHICCANCGLVPIEFLKDQFAISLFWYDPNIHPKEEYEKRLVFTKKISVINKLPLIIESYDDQKWLQLTKGLEKEPEGGKRCRVCFEMRLEKTAQIAKQSHFDFFATTLGVSKYKNTKLIDQLGRDLAKKYSIQYHPIIVDKNWAAQRELELSKKYNFYRQKYCGCVYSSK